MNEQLAQLVFQLEKRVSDMADEIAKSQEKIATLTKRQSDLMRLILGWGFIGMSEALVIGYIMYKIH